MDSPEIISQLIKNELCWTDTRKYLRHLWIITGIIGGNITITIINNNNCTIDIQLLLVLSLLLLIIVVIVVAVVDYIDYMACLCYSWWFRKRNIEHRKLEANKQAQTIVKPNWICYH